MITDAKVRYETVLFIYINWWISFSPPFPFPIVSPSLSARGFSFGLPARTNGLFMRLYLFIPKCVFAQARSGPAGRLALPVPHVNEQSIS